MEAIKDTANGFDYADVAIDGFFAGQFSHLKPSSDTISNARSYYWLRCPERSYQVVLGRNRVINVDGMNYQYDSLLVENLARVFPEKERLRYLPYLFSTTP